MNYLRLYLVPFNGQQQVIDVPDSVLILSNGQFVLVQTAPTVTLVGVPVTDTYTPFNAQQMQETLVIQQTQELRICWREPIPTQQYPDNNVIEANDPSGGTCVCGITCSGPEITYVQVQNVTVEI